MNSTKSKPKIWLRTFAFLLLSVSALGEGKEPAFYDEIYDANGEVREKYFEVNKVYRELLKDGTNEAKFKILSRKDFSGDNALSLIPRILDRNESELLDRGVVQRGLAIHKFLADYFAGRKEGYQEVVPEEVVLKIAARNHEVPFREFVKPEHVSIPYGADIIRDKNGLFRVIEDNIGYIGGPGDLIHAREVLFKLVPAYKEMLKVLDDPKLDYKKVVERYHALANPRGGKVVMLMSPPYPDNEDHRLKKIYGAEGVEVVTPNSKKQLEFTPEGVFLVDKKSGKSIRQPVGYLILNGEHHFFEVKHPAVLERAWIDEAKEHLEEDLTKDARRQIQEAMRPDPKTFKVDLVKLKKALGKSDYAVDNPKGRKGQFPGLMEAILKGKVASNYSPGIDFVGDKEFYQYVPALIRHYLGEEPILKNIHTIQLGHLNPSTGKVELDEKAMDEVFKNQKNYVVKAVDGRGGDAVWVGPNISKEEFKLAKIEVLKDPGRFIAQPFTALSRQGDSIVDLRAIALVDRLGAYPFTTKWGRTISAKSDGKVNLSLEGLESTVITAEPMPAHLRKGNCVAKIVFDATH